MELDPGQTCSSTLLVTYRPAQRAGPAPGREAAAHICGSPACLRLHPPSPCESPHGAPFPPSHTQAHSLTYLLSLQEFFSDCMVCRQFTSPTTPLLLPRFPGDRQKLCLSLSFPQDRLMFPRMLMKLVSLRTLSSVHSEQVFALRLQDKKLPPLLSEIWDVHE